MGTYCYALRVETIFPFLKSKAFSLLAGHEEAVQPSDRVPVGLA